MPEFRQGQIYMVNAGDRRGAEVGGRRPWVVLQNNLINQTRVATILAVPMTTTPARSHAIGNVTLEPGEGGLRARSVANVSWTRAVDRRFFADYLGQLTEHRIREIIAGLNMLLTPRG